MSKYVIDTQALIKLLNGKKVINDTIDSILKRAEEGEHIIIIPSVVLFEIGYLHEKGRLHWLLKNFMNENIKFYTAEDMHNRVEFLS